MLDEERQAEIELVRELTTKPFMRDLFEAMTEAECCETKEGQDAALARITAMIEEVKEGAD